MELFINMQFRQEKDYLEGNSLSGKGVKYLMKTKWGKYKLEIGKVKINKE